MLTAVVIIATMSAAVVGDLEHSRATQTARDTMMGIGTNSRSETANSFIGQNLHVRY
jgi:hypothetical protein